MTEQDNIIVSAIDQNPVTRDELLEILGKEIVTVEFVKNDGTNRVMKCTRSMNLIDEEFHPKGTNKTVETDESPIRVFDVDKQAWRSFNYDSLLWVQGSF